MKKSSRTLFDDHFENVCRPGGLGNTHSRLDKNKLYLGAKVAQHGIKHFLAQIWIAITAFLGPYKGKVHDGRILREQKGRDWDVGGETSELSDDRANELLRQPT